MRRKRSDYREGAENTKNTVDIKKKCQQKHNKQVIDTQSCYVTYKR